MNKIDLNNRVSVDGELQSQKKIEKWYVYEMKVKSTIEKNLDKLQFDKSNSDERQIINLLKGNLL